jgi:hypothetical protein
MQGDPLSQQTSSSLQEFTMTFLRTALSISALTTATLAASAWAANDGQHDSHHPAAAGAVQIAQAAPGNPAMGTGGMGGMTPAPGYADQMKAMQQMHEKMVAAKTPAERNALMAEQMKLMQNGMNMMGGMGGMGAGTAPGKPADMTARQGMLEQRMDMMQSMMQMMMDRMQSVPVTK